MSTRVFTLLVQTCLKKVPPTLPVPHSSEHHTELEHQTPVPPSSASALLSLNKQRPFTYSPTIKRDLLDCLHKLTTYLPTSLLSRQNHCLPALHQSDHHYRPYNQASNRIRSRGTDSKPDGIASIFFMIISSVWDREREATDAMRWDGIE